jgi:hypothetical protein
MTSAFSSADIRPHCRKPSRERLRRGGGGNLSAFIEACHHGSCHFRFETWRRPSSASSIRFIIRASGRREGAFAEIRQRFHSRRHHASSDCCAPATAVDDRAPWSCVFDMAMFNWIENLP